MKQFIVFLFTSLLIVSEVSQAQSPLLIKNKNFQGVVFNEKISYPFFKKKQRFTPSLTEITTMEDKLRNLIKKLISEYKGYINANCKITTHLSNYKRQYFGYIDKGEKIVFTSFIYSFSNDWKRNIVFAEGGGCNYFKIKFTLNKKTFYDLSINPPE